MYFVTMRRSFGRSKKNTQKRWVDHRFSMVSGTPPLYQLKKTANFVLPSHEALFKGPTSGGGLSHLLPTKPGGVLACYSLPDGTLQMSMRSWREWIWKNIIHVVERAFIKGAAFPFK